MITLPSRRKCASLLLSQAVLISVIGAGLAAAAPAPSGGTVSIQTVPALEGVRVALGSHVVRTGADGSASVQVSDLNGIASRVELADTQLDATDTITLAKVQPAPHAAAHESHLTLGLDVTSRVALQIDPGGTGVSPDAVVSLSLHSVTGERIVIDPRQESSVSLSSRRTRLQNGVLTSQVVTWSVDSVSAGRGVAVSAMHPRFDPFGQSTWQLKLHPVRGTLIVDTVPKTAGVSFALDGATITTGEDGRGQGVITDLNDVVDRVRLDSGSAGPLSVSLVRVAKLPPGAPFHRHVLAVLTVRRPVSLAFRDASGAPVSPGRISEVRLQGGGATVTLTGREIGEPVSLLSGVATQVDRVWQSRRLTYAIVAVHLEGSNAVFAGKQRFSPTTSATWHISVAVFNLHVTVRDVVFGRRISSSVWVTRPNGEGYGVHLGAAAPTVLTSLVRGSYDLQAKAAVYGSHTKVLVSRNDSVDLRVVTRLDVIVMVLALALVAGSVIVFGRMLRGAQVQRSKAGGT